MVRLEEEKVALRKRIWAAMEKEGIARFPLPLEGRIPNFEGSEGAAARLSGLEEWKRAKMVFANPDSAQRAVRELALRERKTLVMASPRLKHGYIRIEPEKVKGRERVASSIAGAFALGEPLSEPAKPDLVITGCVAVDPDGWRVGKGGGYGDREIATIRELHGKVPVATTVHDVQVVGRVPHGERDQRVDIIVTPTRVIRRKA